MWLRVTVFIQRDAMKQVEISGGSSEHEIVLLGIV